MPNIFLKNRTSIIGAGFIIVLMVMVFLLLTSLENGEESSPSEIISVAMMNYRFQPDTLRLPTGKRITLEFTNKDTVEHEFLAGKTINADSTGFETGLFDAVEVARQIEQSDSEQSHTGALIELAPGQTGTLIFTLPTSRTGTYAMGCFEMRGDKTHFELGMKGIVIVHSNESASSK